jgi:hypothetical protein
LAKERAVRCALRGQPSRTDVMSERPSVPGDSLACVLLGHGRLRRASARCGHPSCAPSGGLRDVIRVAYRDARTLAASFARKSAGGCVPAREPYTIVRSCRLSLGDCSFGPKHAAAPPAVHAPAAQTQRRGSAQPRPPRDDRISQERSSPPARSRRLLRRPKSPQHGCSSRDSYATNAIASSASTRSLLLVRTSCADPVPITPSYAPPFESAVDAARRGCATIGITVLHAVEAPRAAQRAARALHLRT